MLRAASGISIRFGNAVGRSLCQVATASSRLCEAELEHGRCDENPNHNQQPALPSAFHPGDRVLLEFHNMAIYTQLHLKRKPRGKPRVFVNAWSGWAIHWEPTEDVEGWLVEWEAIKLGWDACAQMAMNCDKLEATHTVSIINRCKSGGYVNTLLFTVLVDRLWRQQQKGWKPRQAHVPMVIQSLGMLARMNSSTSTSHILGSNKLVVHQGEHIAYEVAGEFFSKQAIALAQYLLNKVTWTGALQRSYSIRTYSCIMHGIGLLHKHAVPSEMCNPFLKIVDLMLPVFCEKAKTEPCLPVNLSQILHACALLGHTTYVAELCNLIEHSMRRGVFYGEQDISNIVWALGKLNAGPLSLCELLWAAIMDRMASFTPRGLSKVVQGLGMIACSTGRCPTTLVLKALGWTAKTPNMLRACTNTELCIIVTGFGMVGFRPPWLVETLMGEINRRTQARWSTLAWWSEHQWQQEISPGSKGSYFDDEFKEEFRAAAQIWLPDQVLGMEAALGLPILKVACPE